MENFEALISGKEAEITKKFKEELRRDPGNIFKKFSVSKMDPDAVKAVRAQIEDMAREHVVKNTIMARMVTMEREKLISLDKQRSRVNGENELDISQEFGASLGPEDSQYKNRLATYGELLSVQELEPEHEDTPLSKIQPEILPSTPKQVPLLIKPVEATENPSQALGQA